VVAVSYAVTGEAEDLTDAPCAEAIEEEVGNGRRHGDAPEARGCPFQLLAYGNDVASRACRKP